MYQAKPTEDEMEHNRSFLLGSFMIDRETPEQIANDMWLIESQQLPCDYLEKLLEGISKTTDEDCLKLIQETIRPDNLVIVVIGPANQLKEQLEKIAPVVVISKNDNL